MYNLDKNFHILEEGHMWIENGGETGKELWFGTDDDGYIAKYKTAIVPNNDYNPVEVAARKLVDQVTNHLMFKPVDASKYDDVVRSYDDVKACLLNKALEIKNQVDSRDFTKYAGRVDA